MAATRRKWTTLRLERQADGTWVATQDGVGTTGAGETAALAAAAYCQRVAEGDDGAG